MTVYKKFYCVDAFYLHPQEIVGMPSSIHCALTVEKDMFLKHASFILPSFIQVKYISVELNFRDCNKVLI